MVQHARLNGHDIPDIVIRRLPIYVRTLLRMRLAGVATVSSDDLAEEIGVTAAQIRRDLSYFGKFGKQGKGYEVPNLVDEIQSILNLDRQWDVALVGFGHLGQAVAAYRGFEQSAFHISAIFDRDPANIGDVTASGVRIMSDSDIVRVVRAMGIRMGIVAVPAASAQEVTSKLIEGGVTAILNYAPVVLRVPEGVWVREIDPTGAMQSMTYYLARHDGGLDPLPTGGEEHDRVCAAADGD